MNRLICFLDKDYPPDHSFVDGYLLNELPSNQLRTILVVSKGKSEKLVHRNRSSIIIATLKSRRGLNRFINLIKVIFILNKLLRKYANDKTVIFVRNEPIYLLSARILRKKYHRLIFQQSFPHEIQSGFLKKTIAICIFRLTQSRVDQVLGVSQIALKRLKEMFFKVSDFDYIPLCAYDKIIFKGEVRPLTTKSAVHFVYIGTHAKERALDILINVVIRVMRTNSNVTFTFIGGNANEIASIYRTFPQILEFHNLIDFKGKINRDQLISILHNYDVGISLIPPTKVYKESSPTKLVEYMSRGVVPFVNKEIQIQKQVIEASKAGYLTSFSSEDIYRSILKILDNKDQINKNKTKAIRYVKQNFNYKQYTSVITKHYEMSSTPFFEGVIK